MVRNRERKTEKGNFNEDDIRQVVLLVQQGMSIRQAAKEKSLKYLTLSRYVKKQENADGNGEQVRMRPNYDCRKMFTEHQEEELKKQLAYEMAKINSIPHPKSWDENNMAGIDWYLNFMRRHPQLSSRTPEGCSLFRAASFNRTNVKEFFDNLENVLAKFPEFADGTRILNLDDRPIPPVPAVPSTSGHDPNIHEELISQETNSIHTNTSNPENVPFTSVAATMNETRRPTKPFLSPTEFRGFPKADERKRKHSQRKGRSMIATSTPEKQTFIERKKCLKAKVSRKALFRGKEENSEDENDTEIILDDNASNEEDLVNDVLESLNPDEFEDLDKEPAEGDYVLVQYCISGKRNVFYVGLVVGSNDEDKEYEILFLRKSNEIMNKFVKPQIEDRASISANQIKIILPKPTTFGQTKRQNSYLSFGIDFSLVKIK